MEKFNNQTAFTTAAKGMLSQMERSEGGDGCKYRTTKGSTQLCCGVGFLLTDEEAHRADTDFLDGSGTGVMDVVDYHEDIADKFSEVDSHLLSSIQNIHDNGLIECWEEELVELATHYNLKWEL